MIKATRVVNTYHPNSNNKTLTKVSQIGKKDKSAQIKNRQITIVQDLKLDDWSRDMINKTQQELVDEKNDALKATKSEWLDGSYPKSML